MILDEVWGSMTEEEGQQDTYVDAMGNQQNERLAPFPPPSLREKGNSAVNSHRLEMHTGLFQRRTKGGDVPAEEDFDLDLDRPAKLINQQATDRLGKVVIRNRQGVQDAPLSEKFSKRDDIYSGYNVSLSKLSRTPKVQTTTQRAMQEWVLYGPEVHGEDHYTLRANLNDPLKAGVVDGDAIVSQGRSSALGQRGAERLDDRHTAMGGRATLQKDDARQGRKNVIDGTPLGKLVNLAKNHLPNLPVRKLVTSSEIHGETERATLLLGQRNDVVNDQGHRRTGGDTRGTLRAKGSLGDSDSTNARDPYRKTTFSQSAMLAEHIINRTGATQSRDAHTVQPDFRRQGLHPAVRNPLRHGAVVPLEQGVGRLGDFTAVHSQRGRDLAQDSTRTQRVVANTHDLDTVALGPQKSRKGPDDSIHTTEGAFGRAPQFDGRRATQGVARLGITQDRDIFNTNARTGNVITTIAAAVSSLLTRKDSTVFTGARSTEGPLKKAQVATSARRLRDDDVSQSHVPLAGGSVVTARAPPLEFHNDRKEATTLVVRQGIADTVTPPKPAIAYNGHRD